MLNFIERLLVLPAHMWVWVITHNIIPASVWDRLMVWRTRK